ncbi:MAG: MFS transporter [Desulfofustis sp.]
MDAARDSLYRQNVLGVSVVEFLWGLGFPIVLESTFLQLFLKSLGASSFMIGAVPFLFIFGISCFPLFASYFSRNYRFKRPLVIVLHLAASLSVLLFGIVLLFVKDTDLILRIFLIFYALFSISLGMCIPVWLNYLVRIFSEARTVPGLGYMMLFQNIGKIISSFFVLAFVQRYAFSPASSAWVFIWTGVVFSLASFCFLLTREVAAPDDPEPDEASFMEHISGAFDEIVSNRRFLFFLAADLDFYVVLTVFSFYANYATSYYEVAPAAAAGLFVASIYAGSVTVNIVLGTMNLLSLKQKFILSKWITLTLLILLVFFPAPATFFLISFLLGFVRAIRNVVYPPSIKKFAARADATPYFSMAPVLTLPFAAGYPLIFGKMLDQLAWMQQDSYRLLFGVSACFILFTLYLSSRVDYR